MLRKLITVLIISLVIQIPGVAAAQNHSKALQNLGSSEVMFAQMMIPHHEQAVDMAKIALKKSPGSAISSLSREIIAAQGSEIAEMKFWLKAKKAPLDMGHSMPMKGMLSDKDFRNLRSATGVNFQRQFLSLMILHHEGALEMVSLLKNSKNSDARKLAQAITTSQKAEIQYMKRLLKG